MFVLYVYHRKHFEHRLRKQFVTLYIDTAETDIDFVISHKQIT